MKVIIFRCWRQNIPKEGQQSLHDLLQQTLEALQTRHSYSISVALGIYFYHGQSNTKLLRISSVCVVWKISVLEDSFVRLER